jgi:hypothetical protein
MGPIGCHETSVINYQSTLRKSPRRPKMHAGAENLLSYSITAERREMWDNRALVSSNFEY